TLYLPLLSLFPYTTLFRSLSTLPPEIRRIIVNYPASQGFIGDRELLRGDVFDVVEIRGGDQMKGNLKEAAWKLATFYGDIEFPRSEEHTSELQSLAYLVCR